MPIDVFDAIKPSLQGLLGGARVALTGPGEEEAEEGHVLRKPMVVDEVTYLFSACRHSIPFTRTEEVFCGELVAAFAVLYAGFRQEGYAAHFRTALLASLMDITVARFLRGDHRKAFWSIQQLIQLLKNLSYQRYEGKPATTGFLVYRTTLVEFRKRVRYQKSAWLDLNPQQALTPTLFDNPITYRFIDGTNSLFAANVQMQLTGIVKPSGLAERDEVDRHAHRSVFALLRNAGAGAFAVKVNESSEIEAIICPDKLLVRRRGQWGIFDPDIFRSFLAGCLDPEEIEELAWTLYTLSKARHGTVVLILERGDRQLARLKRGSVGGDDPLGMMLAKRVKGKTISQLKQSGELMRLLSSDGMTVFSRRGRLLDTGVIIDTSHARELVTGGGRTTAATAASFSGRVIKVSEDGPIELYQGGARVYSFG
jgi:hypothetical protein